MTLTTSRDHVPAASLATRARQHPVAAFFVLSYAYSWISWAPAALGVDGPAAELLVFVGVWGPAAAGLTVLVLRNEIEGTAYATMQFVITLTMWAGVVVLLARTHGRLGPATPDADVTELDTPTPVGAATGGN